MPFGDTAAALGRGTAPAAASPGPRGRTFWLLAAAVALLWLATRPYRGVIHDSRLYTFQALSAADPARFAEDLFLRFGSQDRFTIFSRLYEPVLGWAGVSLGAMLLTLAAQAAWLGGAYCLAKAIFRDPPRALAAVAVLVALPSAYGAHSAFSYGEPFVTPRLFAEALTFFALGRALRGSTLGAAAALAVAGAFHPVMALPGVAVFFLYNALGNRAWWAVAACAGIAAGGLVALGIEPFARVGVRLDPEWFETVRQRAPYAFLGGWSPLDWAVLAGQAALALLMLTVPGRAEVRRLVVAVLLAAAGGVALTGIGADLAQNQLVANLQPWRATWLLAATAHLLALSPLAAFVGKDGVPRGATGMLVAGGMTVLFLARLLPGAHLLSAALLVPAAALAAGRRAEAKPLRPRARAMVAGISAAVGLLLVLLCMELKGSMEAWPAEYRGRLWAFALCIAGLALAAAAGSPPRRGTSGATSGPATAAAITLLLSCAALGWDQRTAWAKFVESSEPPPEELAGFVPAGATAYWDGGLELLWFRLRRPSYHSCTQGAGVMFFRGTASAYRQRGESFRFGTFEAEFCTAGPGGRDTRPDRSELRRACAREPELDVVVLPHAVEGVPRREWAPPAKLQIPRVIGGKVDVAEFDRFYAYACADLR